MLVKLKDNTPNQKIAADGDCSDGLMYLSAQTIGNLKDDRGGNILIFPHSFRNYGDEVDKEYVFSVNSRFVNGKNKVDSISTGNMMGFIGINGVDISISSRFSDGTDRDFFLMYMLQQVLSVNVMNLKYGVSNQEKMFELLVFMFPVFLRRAMRQGVFRQYVRKNRNDSNLRGVVNVKEHLKKNTPFNYRIAYSVREFEADNCVMQLIRHTIEYIRSKKEYKHILVSDRDIDGWVEEIVSLTTSYNIRCRNLVIKDNIRPLSHPYYTEYIALQKLCVRILRYEKVGYGKSDDKIYGILFDGAWLWEEYLATLLKPLGYLHPKNKTCEGKIFLCTDHCYPRYPDFYREDDDGIVLDAKYKRDFDTRNDLNQLLTYMYRLKSRYGAFILPSGNLDNKTDLKEEKLLLGYGGVFGTFRMLIPKQNDVDNFDDYIERIKESEESLQGNLKSE